MTLRNDIYGYLKKKYKSQPEYLWRRYPNYAVFRHSGNRKWYAIIMDVQRDKLAGSDVPKGGDAQYDGDVPEELLFPIDGDANGTVDIINVKVADRYLLDVLAGQPGYYKEYHMSYATVSP